MLSAMSQSLGIQNLNDNGDIEIVKNQLKIKIKQVDCFGIQVFNLQTPTQQKSNFNVHN